MAGLVIPDGQGELTIGSVSMSTPAWLTLDLSPLWAFPETRGANVTMPGASGRRGLRRRVDETTYQLMMLIIGDVDQDGDSHADPAVGLVANLDYLWENVVAPPDDSPTRSAVLEMPDGSFRGADVQVGLVVNGGENDTTKPAVLYVTVPAGRFVEAGS